MANGSTTMPPTGSSSSSRWPGGKAHLEDNLTFLAGNLSPKKNESSRETLRRYLSDSFFKGPSADLQETSPSTGSSQVASRRRFRASFTCTATTKVHWPGCVPST